MCWPSCKGGAYLAVSVFIYRAILVIISMISSSITRLKSTYLPITVMEELLLQLIYFIPIFTSSSFIFIGLESNSFTYVLYSTVALSLTLFIRYVGEIAYIYSINWEAYRLKTPSLYLNLTCDLILLLILLLYAQNRLKNSPWKNSKQIYKEFEEDEKTQLVNQTSIKIKDTNIQNELHNRNQTDLSTKGQEVRDKEVKGRGIGQGVGEGEALHYPMVQVDKDRLMRPLPKIPNDEFDDVSLPPPIPLASPDYDDI